MLCLYPPCKRKGKKLFRGYCSKVHYKLDKAKPKKLTLSCAYCGIVVKRNPSEVSKSGKVYCKKCKKPRGENHVNWKGGSALTGDGYRLIKIEDTYIREHRYVWEQYNKARLIPWSSAHVHHINFNKLDNRPENLLLLSSTEHASFHNLLDHQPEKAIEILMVRAKQQLFYPSEVEIFANELLS